MNRSNVTDEDLDDGWATPIHRPTWKDAEVATERQAKAWGECLDLLIQQYSPLNMAAAVQLMADYFHVRPENYERLTLQFQRFIHENPKYEIRKGKSGGVFRSSPATTHSQAVVVDDYTCGCGNTKLSTKTDKSCWRCGAAVCGATS